MDKQLQAKLAVLASVNRELLASQARYEALLDLLPVGVTILSTDGVIQYVNNHIVQMTGLPAEQIIGYPFDYSAWNISSVDQAPLPDDELAFVKILHHKSPFYNLESCIMLQPDQPLFISISGMPLFDEHGEVKEVVLVTLDITAQKQAARQTELARAKQEELLQWQNRLLAIIGHDLRNPLSIISTSADFLELTDQKNLSDTRQRRYKNIQTQTKRLANMLRNVDSVYRSQVGQLQLELSAVELPSLLQQVLDDLTERHQHSYAISIRTAGPEQPITADKDSLYLVFDNLLSNAIKYATQDPVIQIEVGYEAEQVLISLRDNGIGIPPEAQAHLFTPFYRASNVGQIKGTGLGLSNVKTFIEAHGGNITLESQPGIGSTFFIRLPYHQPQTGPAEVMN